MKVHFVHLPMETKLTEAIENLGGKKGKALLIISGTWLTYWQSHDPFRV